MYNFLIFSLISLIPSFVQAQGLKDVLSDLINIADIFVLLAVSAALLVFLGGMAKFISKSGDAGSHEGGRRLMVWGIIALFVIVTFWGIIRLIQEEFNFTNDGIGGLPSLQDPSNN